MASDDERAVEDVGVLIDEFDHDHQSRLHRLESTGRLARARDEESGGVAPGDPEPSLWTCTNGRAEVRAGRERPRAGERACRYSETCEVH